MTELFPPGDHVRQGTQGVDSLSAYRDLAARAMADPETFWLDQTRRRLEWTTAPTLGLEGDFRTVREAPLRWFGDGTLNITHTCLDRHLQTQPDKVALVWEGDEPGDVRRLTYAQLHEDVCRLAGALRTCGVKRGERVIIYMGMVPEAAIAMLACARIGAIHSVVFGGFSAEALRDRILDCGAEMVITQDEGVRGGRLIPLKETADAAISGLKGVLHQIVFRRTGAQVGWVTGRDLWWHEVIADQPAQDMATVVDAEHPLFVLYTSGSTGRPKGVVHTCAGYLTYAAYTHQLVFDLRPEDVYACVADVGWITGHSYIVYGPLANGSTTVMFESTPLYPDAGRYWDVVERHKITIFYTAPTAIRALAAQGAGPVERHDLSSLRVLGTVGEPINPEAWRWYHGVVGGGRCAVVDTWWQTETGGMMIAPIAPATPTKPGSATLPLPGILPSLRTPEGHVIVGPGQGLLCIDYPWPGQARSVWGDHGRFVATYFGHVPGAYFTGDGCRRDADGYHWITGRVDDVLNVSGHRMGTAEFEAALGTIEAVAEAAVVGFPHQLKGQGVCAYLVAQPGLEIKGDEVQAACRAQIGAHARVDKVVVVPGLPKTRSGKVMRRILRKIAEGQPDALGDVSTLADPEVVDRIKEAFTHA